MTSAPDHRPPPDHAPEQPHLPLDGVDPEWRLDEHTRAVGLAGVAAARAILDRGRRAA
jgi:hypothetical protein